MQKFSPVAVSLDPLLAIYLHTAWKKLHLEAAKAQFYLDSSHMQYYFSIIDQSRYLFNSMMIRSWSSNVP